MSERKDHRDAAEWQFDWLHDARLKCHELTLDDGGGYGPAWAMHCPGCEARIEPSQSVLLDFVGDWFCDACFEPKHRPLAQAAHKLDAIARRDDSNPYRFTTKRR